jgi:SEC-C motif-containing protein
MRARYSAFAVGRTDFLLATGPQVDQPSLEAAVKTTQWLGLEVHDVEAGGENDVEGTVSFSARFIEGKRAGVLRERSHFERVMGRWRYLRGETSLQPLPAGRNDPCPCGSGQKRKSCHPAA